MRHVVSRMVDEMTARSVVKRNSCTMKWFWVVRCGVGEVVTCVVMVVVMVVVVPDPLESDVNAIVRSIIKRMYP